MANHYIAFKDFKIGDKVRTTKYYKNKKGFHWTGTIRKLTRSFPGGMIDIKLDKKFRHLKRKHGSYDLTERYIRIGNWGVGRLRNPSEIIIRGGK